MENPRSTPRPILVRFGHPKTLRLVVDEGPLLRAVYLYFHDPDEEPVPLVPLEEVGG